MRSYSILFEKREKNESREIERDYRTPAPPTLRSASKNQDT